MEHPELEKERIFTFIDSIEYIPNLIASKTVFGKITGKIVLYAFDNEQTYDAKSSSFDSFIQILEGMATIKIGNNSQAVLPGQFIIVPAHSQYIIKAKQKCKILSTIIKSGYEEVI